MAFNMAWFKAQEEKKKAEELAKKQAENPGSVLLEDSKKQIDVSRSFADTMIFMSMRTLL